jgi:DNA-binding NarL/FixJ family response regulator
LTVTVLIADDQALVRAGFRMILETQADIKVVGEASDGMEAVAAARRLKPQVLLMDIRMPKLNGLEATTALGDLLGHPTRVVVLTTFDVDEYVYEALRAGASGFLLKDAPPEQLISAVRVVAAGEALLAPSVTRRVIERFARERASDPDLARKLEKLTRREKEVLELLARGMSTHEIAEVLFVSDSAVKSHIAHLLTRLDLRDRVQAVAFAYESGLVRLGPERPPTSSRSDAE